MRKCYKRREAWQNQKLNAKTRGIKFLFTFEEWVIWWEKQLGPDWFSKRGCRRGQYVMARIGDKGPYEASNVKCISVETNRQEQVTNGKFNGFKLGHTRSRGVNQAKCIS